MSQPIEHYAVIGDLHTAALVGLDGSVDWLCLPHFDSPSCFTRLLGHESHGFWRIAPAGGPSAILATRRWYRPDTLVLETEFDTVTGTVRVTDCMPIRDEHPHMVRSVEGVSGTVDMRMELVVRFDYGEVVPWVTSTAGLTRLTAGPDSVALWHRVETEGKDLRTEADFTVTEKQRYPFTLVWHPSHEDPPPPLDSYYAVHLTEAFWTDWATQCCYVGPYRDAVVRSLITLKALTYQPTGGIVAAATTSLPEALGGNRNWDYRFCWLRDATLTLESLMRGGYFVEAMAWRDWLYTRSRATSRSCRSCTGQRVSVGSRNGKQPGSPATRARNRSASATRHRNSSSSTSMARSCRRCIPLPAPRACTAERPGASRSS